LSIYKDDVDFFNAKVNIPFAGKYLLGGKLVHMNSVNGVADPVEVLDFDKRAFVLADNGGEINSATVMPTSVRTRKYNENDLQKVIDQIKLRKMDYERLIVEDEIYQLPLKRLLVLAIKNALKKSECDENYFFCIHLPDNKIAILNSNKNFPNNINFVDFKSHLPTPRSEIFIDPRYLFGLLTKIYHWNNAQIGSQFITRRSPNILNRKAENFLSYLTI
jgi:hypothetical protein